MAVRWDDPRRVKRDSSASLMSRIRRRRPEAENRARAAEDALPEVGPRVSEEPPPACRSARDTF
jgi:hypothetical protein